MTRHIVIGTAGHIDHGKTALVRALTGIDTDRLAEEKRRGITIDLGFAHLTLPDGATAGIVDVPGHEDFIRNMVAGATGIDVALLVVAADEGVRPQTREHLDIVRMLDVPAAVVALTKADLVDAEWLALAADDVRARLAGTPYAHAPVVPVSARTGTGLAALLEALAAAARAGARERGIGVFRMPVDRAFTVHGTGTVATGTVSDGAAALGDELRVLPADRSVRVRALQQHGAVVDRVEPGMRAAVALSGIERDGVGRGSWLVSGGWPATATLTARIELLRETGWDLRPRQRVRLHLGTSEVMARVVLLDVARVGPGESALAQLRLEHPVVARYGDRFVLRSYSPVTTIGGGRVLECMPPKRRPIDAAQRALLSALDRDAVSALPALVDAAGLTGLVEAELALRLGPAHERAAASADVVRVDGRLFDRSRLERAASDLVAFVDAWHVAQPLRPGIDRGQARRSVDGASPAVAEAIVDALVRDGRLDAAHGLLSRPGFRPRLSADQVAARDLLIHTYEGAGLAPPRLEELPASLRDRPDLRDILALLERDGSLLPWPPDRWIHSAALSAAGERLAGLAGRAGLSPADFRDLYDLPRRHLIPLLEAFDRLGWTRRQGELRLVVQRDPGVETSPSPVSPL